MIGLVVEGKCYRFAGMMVCEFKGRKFLQTSKTESKTEEIPDIGQVEILEKEKV